MPFLHVLVLNFFFFPSFPLHIALTNVVLMSARLLGCLERISGFNLLGHVVNSQVV